MAERSFRRLLLVLALLGFTLDQTSKYVVFGWLNRHSTHYDAVSKQGSYVLIPGAFHLHTQYTSDPAEGPLRSVSSGEMPHVNRGALFGLLNDRKTSNYVFALVSVVAGAGILGWAFRRNATCDRLLCIALGLILGGTIGNLYDRLVFEGVRDFLYWFYGVNWPVFNIADCCLVGGALLLLFQAFLTSPVPQPEQAAVAEPLAAPLPSPAVAPMT